MPRPTNDINAAFDELEESLRQLQWAAKAMEENQHAWPAVLSARISSARTVAQLLRRDLLNASAGGEQAGLDQRADVRASGMV
jgi:hypothetical protein